MLYEIFYCFKFNELYFRTILSFNVLLKSSLEIGLIEDKLVTPFIS